MGSFHGITSLMLLALALLIGLIGVAAYAMVAAIGYAAIICVAVLIICGAYCAKCPCRTKSCGHLFPGLIAQRLPARPQTPYSTADLILTALSLAILLLYPQPWLWRTPMLLILFWLLVAAAVIQIVLKVCRRCRNNHCPMQRLRSRDQAMERR